MTTLGAEADASDARFWLGCALELAATVLQNSGMYLQTKAHLAQMMGSGGARWKSRQGRESRKSRSGGSVPTSAQSASSGPRTTPSYWANWKWWVAFAIFISGVVLDFVALAFLPLTVSVPVGSAGLVVALLCSHFGLHERISPYDVTGIVLIIAGACMTVWFSPRERPTLRLEDVRALLDPRGAGLWYDIGMICVYLFWIGFSFLVPCSVTASILPGVNGVQTMIFGKMVGELLLSTISGNWGQLASYEPYVFILALAASLLLQNHFLQRALSTYDNMIVIPVYYVVICILNCVTSLLFFKDFDNISGGAAGAFAAGICVLCAGCCFLTATHFRNPHRIEAIPMVYRQPATSWEGWVVRKEDFQEAFHEKACGTPPSSSTKGDSPARESSLASTTVCATVCATACAVDHRLAPERQTLISRIRGWGRCGWNRRQKLRGGYNGHASRDAQDGPSQTQSRQAPSCSVPSRDAGGLGSFARRRERKPIVVEIAVAYADEDRPVGPTQPKQA